MSLLDEREELALPLPGIGARPQPSMASVGDYIALLKPRVMSLVIFTALVGLVTAPGAMHPVLGFTALLCIAVGAGAAGALNMWYDADIDALMARTANRPIPAGRLERGEALAFGVTLAVGSVVVLGLVANILSAAMLAFTIFFYAVVYSMWLKRWTSQNIVIGGAAGAFPPMIGWAAKTGGLDLDPILLFLIIFFWTPPHFWALALSRAHEYARAGVPMLPVTAGEAVTRKQILLYTVLLAPLGVTPWLFGSAGLLYGMISITGGAIMLGLAIRLWRPGSAKAAAHAAGKRLFGFSILYLFILFAALLAEQGLRGLGW